MTSTVRPHLLIVTLAAAFAAAFATTFGPGKLHGGLLILAVLAVTLVGAATVVVMRRGARNASAVVPALTLFALGTFGMLGAGLIDRVSVNQAVWWVSLVCCVGGALWMFVVRR